MYINIGAKRSEILVVVDAASRVLAGLILRARVNVAYFSMISNWDSFPSSATPRVNKPCIPSHGIVTFSL